MKQLLAELRRLFHRHNPAGCWCEPTPHQIAVANLPVNRGYTYCDTCWVGPGERHTLSCPEVSVEQAMAVYNAPRGGTR